MLIAQSRRPLPFCADQQSSFWKALRHSALSLYVATGATIAELQAHAGHASPEAAMRYQHATEDRSTALAALVDKVIAADEPESTAEVRPPAALR